MGGQASKVARTKKLFASQTAGSQVVLRSKTVAFQEADTIRYALATLAKNKYLSAPLFCPSDSKSWEDSWKIVDLLDIVRFLVEKSAGDLGTLKEALNHTLRRVECREKNFYVVGEDTPLEEVAQEMNKRHIHRVGVASQEVFEESKIMGLITQHGVARWLLSHIAILGEMADKTIKELNLGFQDVYSVGKTESVQEAIHCMVGLKVTALAVVDRVSEKDVLVGSLALEHFRGLVSDTVECLFFNVEELLSSMDGKSVTHVSCTDDASFHHLVELMVMNRVHRVFVVNEENEPIGLISLTDLVDTFISNLYAE